MQPEPRDVLVAHTFYREPGGEDVVFGTETGLLETHGHRVTRLVKRNTDLPDSGPAGQLQLAASAVWSRTAAAEVSTALRTSGARVAHFHNTLPQLSPSVYSACRQAGVPVVQTLHNYRPGCVNGLLFRDGAVCEDCVGRRVAWPGVVHACYRESRLQSAVVAAAGRVARSADDNVALYLALTDFAKDRFAAMGLPREKILVKPNTVSPDPGVRVAGPPGADVVFVGRLSPEKGVMTLLDAAAALPEDPFVLVGDGPQRPAIEQRVADEGLDNVRLCGSQPAERVYDIMRGARCVVVPSVWYETFGRVVAEAYACGVPVVASRIGALAELVDDGQTGCLFIPGSGEALSAALQMLLRDDDRAAGMGAAARERYERDFSAERGYADLLAAYQRALAA